MAARDAARRGAGRREPEASPRAMLTLAGVSCMLSGW
jgi:hypothetical protein